MRKLLLTGVLIRFEQGSLVQTVMAMVIIVLHLVLLSYFKPYKKGRDMMLALVVYTVLLLVFLATTLLMVQGALREGHPLAQGISTATIAGTLIFSVLSVLIITAVGALDEVHAALQFPVLQHAGKKEPVVFETYADQLRFHLFLSHVW